MNGELSYHSKRLGNNILNEACNHVIVGLKAAKGFKLFKQTYGHDPTWRRGGGVGGGVLFARKKYTVPECLIVEIRFLLPQNVRKKHSFTILKSHKTVCIRNIEFLEPHIKFMQNKLLPLN